MATIDNPEAIAKIIAANGAEYPDEPPVVKIVQYTNANGGTCYGVTWEGEPLFRYDFPTPWIQNPVVMWERNK